MEKPLASLRDRLDAVDQRIVDALVERLELVAEVARSKIEANLPVRHIVREEDILTRIAEKAREAGLDAFFATRVFQEVLDHSVRVQQEILTEASHPGRASDGVVVGFQGAAGAYSHLAAQRYFSASSHPVTFRGFESFRRLLEAVRDAEVEYGLLPIENTTAGSINDAYDLLAQMDLALVGEEVQRVDHCLVGLAADVQVSELRRVFSHPQALAQCTEFLARFEHIQVESFTDTAMAVERVRDEGDRTQAAIASEEAARLNGLPVIERSIANQPENYTRMVVVAREPIRFDLRVPCKTSIVFATRHEEGALLHCLEKFAHHHLSLTKLESRPRPRSPWEYLFYVDFEGNMLDPEVDAALRDLQTVSGFLKVLGSYPARNTSHAQPARPRPLPARAEAAGKDEVVRETRVIRIGDARVGGPSPVIAVALSSGGSEAEVRELAHQAKLSGAELAFGPRRSAEAVHGSLVRLVEEQGLAFVHEVARADAVDAAARTARALLVRGRNMEDHTLLEAVGVVDRPVFLERASMASVDEWLAAAEVILKRGNQQVMLIDAGVRSLDGSRRGLDVAALSALAQDSQLPILVDPAGASPSRAGIGRLGRAALVSGVHGVILDASADEMTPAALAELAHSMLAHAMLQAGDFSGNP